MVCVRFQSCFLHSNCVLVQTLGYQRTLQATDLWKMDESREAGHLGAKLDAAWDARVKAAEDWNKRLANGEIKPGVLLKTKWFFRALRSGTNYKTRRQDIEETWRTKDGRKEASLAWSLNDTFGFSFWLGGCFKVCPCPRALYTLLTAYPVTRSLETRRN